MREQAPIVYFLMETRLDKHRNASGGLAFLWKNTINLELINYTANHVLVVVTEEDGFRWFLTCFYE